MTAPILIHEWRKNASEVVRVSLDEFNGRPIVGIRVWFDAGGGEMRPGKSGIAMAVTHLPQLRFAMDKATREVFGDAPDQGGAD